MKSRVFQNKVRENGTSMEINEKAKVLFGRKHKNSFKSDLPFLALLLPAMIVTLIFAYLPMVGLVLAFEDFDMFKGYLSPLTDHFEMCIRDRRRTILLRP